MDQAAQGRTDGRLGGRVAVVTGASKGIGAEIARRFAAEGAAVVVNYASSRSAADRVVEEIRSRGGRAIAVQADLAQPGAADGLFDAAVEAFGHVDVLVNNAGVYEFATLEEITPEHFHRMYDLNVLGLLLSTQAAVRRFPKRGGSIINVSSVASTGSIPASAAYSGTKAAVDAVTRVLAQELGPRAIRINAINPGMVETEGARSAGLTEGELRKEIEADTPLGRIGAPKDISGAAVFLASDDAAWITGETLFISGGLR